MTGFFSYSVNAGRKRGLHLRSARFRPAHGSWCDTRCQVTAAGRQAAGGKHKACHVTQIVIYRR